MGESSTHHPACFPFNSSITYSHPDSTTPSLETLIRADTPKILVEPHLQNSRRYSPWCMAPVHGVTHVQNATPCLCFCNRRCGVCQPHSIQQAAFGGYPKYHAELNMEENKFCALLDCRLFPLRWLLRCVLLCRKTHLDCSRANTIDCYFASYWGYR